MKSHSLLIVLTIWYCKSTLVMCFCQLQARFISRPECNIACNEKEIILQDCECSDTPSINIINAMKVCPMQPLSFNKTRSHMYDLVLNNTLDLDKDCMNSLSIDVHILCNSPPNGFYFSIFVMSVNEFLPSFCLPDRTKINSTYSINVDEKNPPGSKIWSVSVCDEDRSPGENGLISVESVDGKNITGVFRKEFVAETSGVHTLFLAEDAVLDYDIKNVYLLKLLIKDGELNAALDLTINVKDIDDKAPAFDKWVYHLTIKEGMYTHSCTVGTLHASDQDKGINETINYALVEGPSVFSVDNLNGTVCVNGLLDRETKDSYLLIVKGYQVDKPSERFSFTTVVVAILDVDDNPPKILEEYGATVQENAPIGTFVIQVQATDADKVSDKDPYQSLTYKIVAGGNSSFIIDSSGVIRVNKTLDREQISSYNITVTVTDHGNHTTQSTFHVKVLDVNDESPMFSNTSYSFQVVEETPGTLFIVTAHDRDSGQNGVVEYELQNNLWTSDIAINNTTGEVHIKSIDRENLDGNNQIQLLVIAKDHGVPQQHGFAWITITIKDINDHAPAFKEHTKSFDLKEGYTGVFYHAQAIDLDAGENAGVHYRMIRGHESIFIISDNGTVSLQQPLVLDGRSNDSITLEIEAYNRMNYTNPKLTNGRQTLIVHILDINDKNPVFSSSEYHVNMRETLQTGSFVGSVHATDKDYSSEFNIVTYWIQGGNNNTFYIDSRTGTIYLTKAVDFDPPSSQTNFILEIHASDLHKNVNGSMFNASTRMNIRVIDENDNIPIFKKDPVYCVLPENKYGTFNCTVKATDADILDLNAITYNITDPYKIFTVNWKTGEVQASKSLDYERNPTEYTISVSAVDTAQHHGSRELKIYLQDENDEIPHFINTSYSFSMPENERSNTFVGRVVATDKDKGSKLTYTLKNTNDFNITENGEIFTTKVFDCEDHSGIIKNLTVQVTDSMHIQTTNVTVHVLDQNDNNPIFAQNFYEETINESVAIGFHVLKVTAYDTDISTKNNGLVKYKLLQVDGQHFPFSVNGTTGDVKVATNLTNPYQAQYIFSVMAEDQAIVPSERRTNSCEVRIHITRINLHSPVINYPSDWAHIEISEAANVNSILLQVNATDEDFDILTYRLNVRQDYFKIDNRSGVITVQKALDREELNRFILPISVVDGKHLSAVHRIQVFIIDVNDNGPVFSNTNYTLSITEESSSGLCGVIKALDADEGMNSNLTYQIIDGNSLGKFHINFLTGELTADRIDREKFGSKAHLIIRASDQGTPQMTNVTVVEVHIQDINDNPPVFGNKSIHLKVREGEAVGTFVYQLEATDADEGDNAIVKYRKKNGSSFLDVNGTGAILITQSPSVNKTNGMLELYVEAYNTVPYAIFSIQNPIQLIHINITVGF